MKPTLYNDQAHIAEEFRLHEDYMLQTARLAFFKISSYKLSLVNTSFCVSREEFKEIIRNSLFNYADPAILLSDLGFFLDMHEN